MFTYYLPLDRVESQCICGAPFDAAHGLSYKKGGFITLRHNGVWDKTSELLDEICVNVRKKPILQEVNNEDLPREANKNKETHLNISVRRVNNFWTTSQRAFFNVRVISSLRDIIDGSWEVLQSK